jgi:hypothetical protein
VGFTIGTPVEIIKSLMEIDYFVALCISFWQRRSWRNLFAYMGPGFLVSIAYIDPGNCKIVISLLLTCHHKLCANKHVYHTCNLLYSQLKRICRREQNSSMRCVCHILM